MARAPVTLHSVHFPGHHLAQQLGPEVRHVRLAEVKGHVQAAVGRKLQGQHEQGRGQGGGGARAARQV